jgi:hypothetical protein
LLEKVETEELVVLYQVVLREIECRKKSDVSNKLVEGQVQ